MTLVAGLRAASYGIPFQPVAGVHGSELARINQWQTLRDPYGSGTDVYVIPAIRPDIAVIHAAEAVGGFEPNPDDPVPGHEISLAVISPRLYENLMIDLGERIWPQLQQKWPLIDYCGLRDAFIIKYSLDGQTDLRIHHDVAQVSASVKLNDSYEGAELEFPQQSFTNGNVPVGSLLAWPSLVTHPHQTLPLTGGIKYGLTIWFELPEQYN